MGRRAMTQRLVTLAILGCVLLPFLLIRFTPQLQSSLSCPLGGAAAAHRQPLQLGEDAFCSGTACFPRIRTGICISPSQVILCGTPLDPAMLPRFMRFLGERLTVPVVQGRCDEPSNNRYRWISGIALVADQRFLPYQKPNPHHEAEKIIPATLLLRKRLLQNSSLLYWYASPSDVSSWAAGFLEALDMKHRVVFVDILSESPLCFEDAVLFSGPTNVRYIPNEDYNSWLRSSVLRHCNIPILDEAHTATKEVVILDRSGSRHLEQTEEMSKIITRVLGVSVRKEIVGNGSFCHQVSRVASEDFLVVPHGSQNVNLLFARPGARVMEVFPFLFYNTALRNYTHAARIQLYPVLGKQPPHNALLRLFSVLGWDVCYRKVRWCKNYSRKQPIYADVDDMEKLLRAIKAKQ